MVETDLRISQASPAGPLLGTDLVPLARVGLTTALSATVDSFASFFGGAYLTQAAGDARYLQLSGGSVSGSLAVSGGLTAQGTNILAGSSNLSGATTGYSDTALTVGRNAGGAGYVNLITGASGLSIYATNGSGVIATPYVAMNQTGLTTVGVMTVGAGGATWNSGTGAPTATRPVGSLYSRTDGAVGSTLYVSRGGGTWAAVAGV